MSEEKAPSIPNANEFPGRVKRKGKVYDFTWRVSKRGGEYVYKYENGDTKYIWLSLATAKSEAC